MHITTTTLKKYSLFDMFLRDHSSITSAKSWMGGGGQVLTRWVGGGGQMLTWAKNKKKVSNEKKVFLRTQWTFFGIFFLNFFYVVPFLWASFFQTWPYLLEKKIPRCKKRSKTCWCNTWMVPNFYVNHIFSANATLHAPKSLNLFLFCQSNINKNDVEPFHDRELECL